MFRCGALVLLFAMGCDPTEDTADAAAEEAGARDAIVVARDAVAVRRDAVVVRRDGGPRPPVPDWVPPPGEWAEISFNTISELDPCPTRDCAYSAVEGQTAVIDDWNGGVFASDYGRLGSYAVFGGGHNGYFGNEIYLFDLESRRWRRETDPVEAPVCDQSYGELQDGSPCSAHTYSYLNYHPATNSMFEIMSTSNHEVGGGGAPYVHAFDFDARTWRRLAPKPTGGAGMATGASTAFDPSRGETGVFWYVGAYNQPLGYYDPSADTWTEFDRFNIEIDHQSAIDPENDFMVTIDAYTNDVWVHELDSPHAPYTVDTEGLTVTHDHGGPGFQFYPPAGTFVLWMDGPIVWELVPPSDRRNGVWQWVMHDGGGSAPDANMNGTFNRWQWASTIECFIVVNRTTGPVYAYRPEF
jgi:hypothetical protein